MSVLMVITVSVSLLYYSTNISVHRALLVLNVASAMRASHAHNSCISVTTPLSFDNACHIYFVVHIRIYVLATTCVLMMLA
jgi:hypothetical protein